MKFLVIGTGSIGQRHIKNLISLGYNNIEIFDTNKLLAKKIAKKFSINNLSSLKFNDVKCTLICTPPTSHINFAIKAIENNSHVFVEKPLSNKLELIPILIKKAKRKKLNIFVGYVFRFDKGLLKVKKELEVKKIGKIISFDAYEGWFLPKWRPWQDYTKSYTASSRLGGGIILDGSHELNYMLWLGNDIEQVFSYYKTIPKLKIGTEGLAEVILKFKNKAIGRIHLDFINPKYNRHCEIIGDEGSVRWNFEDQSVEFQKNSSRKFQRIKYGENFNQMYVDEIKHIIKVINKEEKNRINISDAINTLKISLAIKKSGKYNIPVRI
jgi:predicted dehydrogenase